VGDRAQTRQRVVEVLRREARIEVEPFTGEGAPLNFFELRREGHVLEIVHLPDIVHHSTLLRFQWKYFIAIKKFDSPRTRRRKRTR
jgi:hypothetical protein